MGPYDVGEEGRRRHQLDFALFGSGEQGGSSPVNECRA